MAYQKTNWVNDTTDVDATNMNHIEDGIEKAYGVELLAVVDTAPSECSEGDKYFNTTTNKIYDATATDTWDTEGYDAESGVFYVVFSERAIYTYNGTTLVGVGSSGAGGESIPVGSILAFGGSNAPEGYLMCDGSNVSRTTYGELFNVIGTTYGQGDGSTTFGTPNLKGKVLVMLDTTQTEFNSLGKTGGSKYLQQHSHDTQIHSGGSQGLVGFMGLTNGTNYATLVGGSQFGIQNAGTGDSGNLQPYIVVNYIIKAHPSAVNTSEVVNEHNTSETDVYSANQTNVEIENAIDNIVDTYSTSEVKTNKVWIDGKPIYRKIVKYSLTDDSEVFPAFNTGILNVDNMFIKIELQYGSNNIYISGITTFNGYFHKQTGDFTFNRSNNDPTKAPVGNYIFIFEYTKTTD